MSPALSEAGLRRLCRWASVLALVSWVVTAVMVLVSTGLGRLFGGAYWIGASQGVPGYVLVLTVWPGVTTVLVGLTAVIAGLSARTKPAVTLGMLCAVSGVLLLVALAVFLALAAVT